MTTEARRVPVAGETRPPDTRMDEFMAMAQYQADEALPQNGDIYTKSFEVAFATNLRDNPEFRAAYEGIFRLHPVITADNLIRQNVKTFQFIERKLNPAIFPRNRSTPEEWCEPMRALLSDVNYQDAFYGNIFKPLASNISERGSPLKAVMMLHGIEYPSILDSGSSLNNVLKRMAMEDDPDLGYNEIEIMRRNGRSRGEPVLDEETSRRFNNWLSPARVSLGPSIGIDIMDFERDEDARERAFSDSHYMGEFVIDNLAQQSDIFEHVQPANVKFRSLDAARLKPSLLGRRFDVTFLSTMLYESEEPEDVQQILDSARAVTKDDGLIVVQDFIRKIASDGTIQFYKRWPKYTYGVWVEDRSEPVPSLRKYFTVYGGRIEKMIPEPALANLPLARKLGLVATGSPE